jgi:hypothetical protein
MVARLSLQRTRWTSFPTAAVADAVPPPAPRLATRPPNNMLIVTSLLKPYAAALLPRQHHVRRPAPATAPLALSPSSRWLRRLQTFDLLWYDQSSAPKIYSIHPYPP